MMANMVDLDRLLPEVMTHARSVPEPTALRYLRNAAIELCQRTKCWAEFDEITITGDDDGEAVTTIEDATIFEIKSARLTNSDGGKYVLDPVTPEWLDDYDPGWKYDFDESTAPGRFVTQIKPNTVMVLPKDTGTLNIRLILVPERKAEMIPDFLIDQFHDLLGKGAAAKVLLLPNTEYTNPNLGAAMWSDFLMGLDELALRSQMKQMRAKPRTRATWF